MSNFSADSLKDIMRDCLRHLDKPNCIVQLHQALDEYNKRGI